MAVLDNTILSEDIDVLARKVDFVSSFNQDFSAFLELLGVSKALPKPAGTALYTKKVTGSLAESVDEGDLIENSKFEVEEIEIDKAKIEKFKKMVTLEAIDEKGYDAAIGETDKGFRNSLVGDVTGRMYNFLATGTLTDIEDDFQSALAMARGLTVDKFQDLDLSATEVVGFCNTKDFYRYLGNANITTQTLFGFEYIRNFMGYRTLFLLPAKYIARGKVIATPVENMVAYYTNPSDSAFARAGLTYTVDPIAPMIGFAVDGDYDRATSNAYAIHGIKLFADYIDGIAVVSIDNGTTGETVTITSAAGTNEGTKITVSAPAELGADQKLVYKVTNTAPAYKDELGADWLDLGATDGVRDDLAGLTGKIVVAVVNGAKQVVGASAATTIVNKS